MIILQEKKYFGFENIILKIRFVLAGVFKYKSADTFNTYLPQNK
jgi:hypothetical protein